MSIKVQFLFIRHECIFKKNRFDMQGNSSAGCFGDSRCVEYAYRDVSCGGVERGDGDDSVGVG